MKKITKEKQFNSNNQVKMGKALVVGLFWLLAWQIASMVIGNPFFLPSVFETIMALGTLVQDQLFYMDVVWTLFRCVFAIILSFVLGILLAWFAYKKEIVRGLMTLPVSFFKAVPVMAVVIYVILVVKADWVAVVACFLMCFPIVYTNILEGLDKVSCELLEVAKIYKLGDFNTIELVYIPSLMPHFNAAMKIVAGLSWKAVVAAEVLSVPEFSLGQGMISAKYYLETPTLFAYIFVIVVMSLTLEKIIGIVTDRLTARNYEGSKLSSVKDCSKELNALPLNIVDLCKDYEDKNVFNGFSAKINAGTKVAILGPSGAGKTTLVRIIAGLEEADSGSVDTGATKISYLFQEDRLFPWLNVYDNMALSTLSNCDVKHEDVLKMAKNLEIEDVLWKMPDELSGGMKHRVALGRTFLGNCNLMILDEPFRGLDEELKQRIVGRLWQQVVAEKIVIVISHSQKDIKLLGIDESIFVE